MLNEPVNHAPFHHKARKHLRNMLSGHHHHKHKHGHHHHHGHGGHHGNNGGKHDKPHHSHSKLSVSKGGAGGHGARRGSKAAMGGKHKNGANGGKYHSEAELKPRRNVSFADTSIGKSTFWCWNGLGSVQIVCSN